MKRFLVIPVILGLLFMVGCLQSPASLPTDSDGTTTPSNLERIDGAYHYSGIVVDVGLTYDTFRLQVVSQAGLVYYEIEELDTIGGLSRFAYKVQTSEPSEFLASLAEFELDSARTEVKLSKEPPEDVTWISPGKVQVGNFYPGATAEWDVLVHNGNDTAASFAVTYRYPDHVGEGYVKPTSIVQEWVIVVDTTPVIGPRDTREILVVLAMPEELKDSQVIFWQITSLGKSFLTKVKEGLYAEFEEEALKQEAPKVRDELLEQIPQKVEEAMLADPITNLLLYLQDRGTVSLEDFGEQRLNDGILVVDLNSQELVSVGDLRKDEWEFWVSVKDTTQTGMVRTELCCRWLITMRQ